MLAERYEGFSRATVQGVKGQTEHFINGCKIYGRNWVNSRWVRRHIVAFEEGVRTAAKFRAVQIMGTSENAKFYIIHI
jgi:hypothetical protein